MTILSIDAFITTAPRDGAGTDGDVYLGICGREFFADTGADDWEEGYGRAYVFGEDSTVLNAASNDPRFPQLDLWDVALYPAYVRFQPKDRDDRWSVYGVEVYFNNQGIADRPAYRRVLGVKGIWLGTRSGLYLHLRQMHDPREDYPRAAPRWVPQLTRRRLAPIRI